MKSVTFRIEGMHCGGCAETVKTLVEKQPGVRMAAVSFDEGQARVLFDPRSISEEHLVAVIQEPGFRVVERDRPDGG